jgi:hypothetical protein
VQSEADAEKGSEKLHDYIGKVHNVRNMRKEKKRRNKLEDYSKLTIHWGRL